MNNYLQLHEESTKLLDAHPELLKLDEPLIQQHLRHTGSEITQLVIPSKLVSILNNEYANTEYYLVKASKNACQLLGIKIYDIHADFTNIVVKKDNFEKTLELIKSVEYYEQLEPLSSIKAKAVKRQRAFFDKKIGVLPAALEEQVQTFVDEKGRDYFVNRAIKDIRKEFLSYSVDNFGNQAYMDRRLKNERLDEVVKEKYKLDTQRVMMRSSADLMKFKSAHNGLGKCYEFFVED